MPSISSKTIRFRWRRRDIRKSINQIRLNSHATSEAKVRLNNAKFNSPNYNYWEEVNRILANSKRPCLIDDKLAQIPDLSNWLASPNPHQIVLGNNSHQQLHQQPPTAPPTSTYKPYYANDVGKYPHHQQLAQYLDNFYEIDYPQPTITCPHCQGIKIIKWGKNRLKCKDCNKTFSV